jgi:iron complex transport system substrate-binding protein
MRIVSLAPSATDMLCALGAGDRVAGITHRCERTTALRQATLITHETPGHVGRAAPSDRAADERSGTLDARALATLAPNLIVTHCAASVRLVDDEALEQLLAPWPRRPRVIRLQGTSVDGMLSDLETLATALGEAASGSVLIRRLRSRIEVVTRVTARLRETPRVALLEGLDPPLRGGPWIPELVRLAGGFDVLGLSEGSSRTLAWTDVAAAAPDRLITACAGLDAPRMLAAITRLGNASGWRDIPAVRDGQVCVIDDTRAFSGPGPRLVDGLEVLANTLHPDTCALPAGMKGAVVPAHFAFRRMAGPARPDA